MESGAGLEYEAIKIRFLCVVLQANFLVICNDLGTQFQSGIERGDVDKTDRIDLQSEE